MRCFFERSVEVVKPKACIALRLLSFGVGGFTEGPGGWYDVDGCGGAVVDDVLKVVVDVLFDDRCRRAATSLDNP